MSRREERTLNDFETRVSIIIPTHNRREDLARCLRSVNTQSVSQLEVIVVDDHSTDGSVEMVRRDFDSVVLVENETRSGPSNRRNQGIKLARGKYLLFLDSDSELPDPDLIARFLQAVELKPRIGCIGGEIPMYERDFKGAVGRLLRFRGGSKRVNAVQGGVSRDALIRCDYLATLNCFVRREIVDEIGGFDPTYQFGGEDVDLGLRVHELGYDNYVMAAVGVRHYKSETGRYGDESYRYLEGRVHVLWKNAPGYRIAAVGLVDFLDLLLFYPLLPLKLVIKLILGRAIKKESWTGAVLLTRAYLWNLRRIGHLWWGRSTHI